MLLYTLKENKNEKLPDAKGLWYAYAITTQMMDVDGLAAHMATTLLSPREPSRV